MGEKIELLVDGGKAVANAAVGGKLGPMGINIAEVLKEINNKTADFKGMKVPVTLEINKDKSYSISIGTPPASQLIKKEANIKSGSGVPQRDKVANVPIELIIKVAKMKFDSLNANDLKAAVKIILGSCNSMGILIENKLPTETIKEVNEGKFDKEINEGKTEASQEKLDKLKEFYSDIAVELKQRQADAEAAKKAEEAKKAEGPEKEAKPAEAPPAKAAAEKKK